MRRMELLAPAGNFEKLETAVRYGADAVYFGGELFGLRAFAGNFSIDAMAEAMRYLHERGKKGYLTVNIYAWESELAKLGDYLRRAAATGVDGFIISDPGVFAIARKVAPQVAVSVSTQANTTNSAAVNFWAAQGAKRAILAREVAKEDLREIVKNSDIEIEVFAHGAICISYSGRCIMSAYMTGREANRGECTQPCRWKYFVTEETRPDQPMEIEADARGTYLYNAKDLALLNRIGELAEMGVASVKIEGRMKSAMYVAVVTSVYRKAIDRAIADPSGYTADPEWMPILESISNRHYTEGFYAGVPDAEAMNCGTSNYVRNSDFLGLVKSCSGGYATVLCKGKFVEGELLYLFTPDAEDVPVTVSEIINEKEERVPNSRAGDLLKIPVKRDIPEGSLLRRILCTK